MNEEQAIIIGAGPCGLAAAIALQKININPLIIEKGNVVNAIHGYPTHQTFSARAKSWKLGMWPFLLNNINQTEIRRLCIIEK